MRLLVDKGADPKLKLKDEATALHATVGIGLPQAMGDAALAGPKPPEIIETMQFLLDRGVDINGANATGMTVLHGAAQKGADEIVQYLADHGAKLDLKDKRGRTALDIAGASAGKGQPAEENMGGFRLEKHPTTVALLRKLMGLSAEEPAEKEEKPVETAKADEAGGAK